MEEKLNNLFVREIIKFNKDTSIKYKVKKTNHIARSNLAQIHPSQVNHIPNRLYLVYYVNTKLQLASTPRDIFPTSLKFSKNQPSYILEFHPSDFKNLSFFTIKKVP